MESIFFNCGEYKPGQEPINAPGVCPPAPEILIPEPPRPRYPQLPQNPRTPIGGGGGGGGGSPGSPGGGSPGIPGQPQSPGGPGNPGGGAGPGGGGGSGPGSPQIPPGPQTPGSRPKPGITLTDDERRPRPIPGRTLTDEERRPNPIQISIDTGLISTPVARPVDFSSSGSSLYDPDRNLFQAPVQSTQITLVPNQIGLTQIFSNQVASAIDVHIRNYGKQTEWSEISLQGITNRAIEASLKPELLAAFESINLRGGQLVGKEPFIETVKKHILTNTLDEFDTSYYINLAKGQESFNKIQFNKSAIQERNDIFALHYMNLNNITADTSKLKGIQQREVRRQKRLNEDVNSYIPVQTFDLNCLDLKTLNLGTQVLESSGTCNTILDGPGDGYYFYLNQVDLGCVPFQYTNNVENSYYVCPEVRINALSILGEDYGIIVRAESSSTHELTPGDPTTPNLTPVYLKLNLSSIDSNFRTNPLVERSEAVYNLVSDQEEINEHLNSNGFAVSRINLDFRDPLFRYIKDTSSLTLEQNDITYRAFLENLSIKGNQTITRTLPAAVIVSPVAGSKFNPFNGFSTIEQVGSSVVRSIRLLPNFKTTYDDPNSLQLSATNMYLETGMMAFGQVEPNDTQNITFRFNPSSEVFTNSFYQNNTYTSSVTQPSSYGTSYLVKDVIDLIASSNPEITWFDVYRRLPPNKFGELLYDLSPDYMNQLSKGARNDMKIRHLLNRPEYKLEEVLLDDEGVYR